MGSLWIDCVGCHSMRRLLYLARSNDSVITCLYLLFLNQFNIFLIIINRHHFKTLKKWQDNHQCVELLSIRGIIINVEDVNNNALSWKGKEKAFFNGKISGILLWLRDLRISWIRNVWDTTFVAPEENQQVESSQ